MVIYSKFLVTGGHYSDLPIAPNQFSVISDHRSNKFEELMTIDTFGVGSN